ncbi:MAG: ABC transporter substrate-binding protein [Candidatus Sifarchaeia archaeon]
MSTIESQIAIRSDNVLRSPHVDKVMYRSVGNYENLLYYLQSGEIDLILDSSYLFGFPTFDVDDPNIEFIRTSGNGYWCIDFNCWRYPLNISGFRRAFAYAFDKMRAVTEILEGPSNAHDSIVPPTSSFCIENELEPHYYTNQADIGNQILDDLGFMVDTTTGYRKGPNGVPISIEVSYYWSASVPTEILAHVAVDALSELHVFAYSGPFFVDHYLTPKSYPEMLVRDANFYTNNVDWLSNKTWSEFATVDPTYWKPTFSFSNSTYDLYLNEMLHGLNYDSVYEAAAEIQRIIHHNVPRLVICPKVLMQAYRTDTFEGHIEDVIRGVSGIWSLCNMHSKTGSSGGTIRIGSRFLLSNFNIYTAKYEFSKQLFDNLWPTLFTIGPNLEFIPNLATSIISETHEDNSAVSEGHTRVTVDILSNATWSDGVPLTAQDVAFTTNYELVSGVYGNPAGQEIEELFAAYAPTPTRAVFEYNTESYWHMFDHATCYIIPKHIFNDIDGIGYEGWEAWDPLFNPQDPHVTCGTFIMDSFNPSNYEMIKNPDYYYPAREIPENYTSTQRSTDPSRGEPMTFDLFNLVIFGVSIGSSAIILVSTALIINHQREMSNLK